MSEKESTAVSESEPLILFAEEDPTDEEGFEGEPTEEEVPEAGEGVELDLAEESKEEEEEIPENIAELIRARDAVTEDLKRQRHRAQEAERRIQAMEANLNERSAREAEERERALKEAVDSGELDPQELKVQELEREISENRAWREQMAVRDEVMRVAPVIVERERAFREQRPDYDDAVRHMHSVVKPQLLAKGYNEWELDGVLERLDLAFAVNQIHSGVDPAEAIYAQSVRMGFTPRDPSGTPQNGQGASPSTAPVSGAGKTIAGAPAASLASMAEKAGVPNRRKSMSNASGGVSATGGKGVKITTDSFEQLEEEDKRKVMAILRSKPELDEQFEVEGHVYVPL